MKQKTLDIAEELHKQYLQLAKESLLNNDAHLFHLYSNLCNAIADTVKSLSTKPMKSTFSAL